MLGKCNHYCKACCKNVCNCYDEKIFPYFLFLLPFKSRTLTPDNNAQTDGDRRPTATGHRISVEATDIKVLKGAFL
ncbi:hypothetical protein L2E82_12102 [Cichorium intybus]|uniref:Uncharacterized protein n=1 Tax=Cichorium intybus TaxID=13427 RepID=A0ACB9GF58_CICIN|nr:hypothetical protein L2E82_12102 [Cichorium intybus]